MPDRKACVGRSSEACVFNANGTGAPATKQKGMDKCAWCLLAEEPTKQLTGQAKGWLRRTFRAFSFEVRTKAVAIAPWLEEDRASTVVSLGDQRSQASVEGRRQPGKLCDGRPGEPCVFSRAGDGTKGWKRVGKNTCGWCGPPGELKAAAKNKKQRFHLQHALNFFTGDVKKKRRWHAPRG